MNWQDTCILHAGQSADHAEQTEKWVGFSLIYLIFNDFIFDRGLARALQHGSHRVIIHRFDQPARKGN
jgi:hypothetical protein